MGQDACVEHFLRRKWMQQVGMMDKLFQALLESAPNAIIVMDSFGRIALVNAETERLFGYRRQELLGTSVELLLPEHVRDGHRNHRRDYLAVLRTRRMGLELELHGRHKDGSEFPAEISISSLETEDGPLITSIIRDRSERKRAVAESDQFLVQRETERRCLEAVLRQMPSGVLIADAPSGRIILANRQGTRLWPDSFRHAAGIDEYARYQGVHTDGRPYQSEEWPLARSILTGEVVVNEEIAFQRGDSTRGTLEVSSVPIRDHDGQIEAGIMIVTEITQRKQAATDRIQLIAAQEAVRVREEFVAIASHELRTPLTAIKGYAQLLAKQLLRSGTDDDRSIGFIDKLQGEVSRLEALVTDLLDAARIEGGRPELRLKVIDLSALAEHALARFLQAPERTAGHTLVLEAPEPVQGIWDPARLDQVLTNLISNALKYSPHGGEVRLGVRRRDDQVEVVVSDQGLGIAPEEREQVFEPFSRTETSHQSRIRGTGLGLYIVAQLVEHHGGTITLQSEHGVGSTFTIQLPLTPPTFGFGNVDPALGMTSAYPQPSGSPAV